MRPSNNISIVHIDSEYKYITITLNITEGIFKGRILEFQLKFTEAFPFEGPKIDCLSPIFHPNIYEGHVCMSILREEWRPVYSIECIIHSLYAIMVDFNSEDAFNTEAGRLLDEDYAQFININTQLMHNINE